MVGFEAPLFLALIPPLAGLVYWLYRRARPHPRPAAGVWLWQRALGRGGARRRVDLRLLLLLLATILTALALARPYLLRVSPGPLVLVIDASASMAATDRAPNRFAAAQALARPLLEAAPQAVLVRAGLEPRVFGPAPGPALLEPLAALQPGDAAADLEAAIRQGQALLPGAPVVVLSDTPPPPGVDGYWNVAATGENRGITALGRGFLAIGNASGRLWDGRVQVGGQTLEVRVPAGGFRVLEYPATPATTLRLPDPDALELDNLAFYRERPPRVRLEAAPPSLVRLLQLLGAQRVRQNPDLEVRFGRPPEDPEGFSVYFATEAGEARRVFDLEPTHPALRSVELVGYALPIPPPPPTSWRPIVYDASGEGLVWAHPRGLYLPPIEALQDLPAFPVLIYNLLAPFRKAMAPLGWNGVLEPQVVEGVAVNLSAPSETFLPRPVPDRPLHAARTPVPLAPFLVLLAALLLWGEARLAGRRSA
nr:VWA domain-containing protein [Marinithermus hydrothermalis]